MWQRAAIVISSIPITVVMNGVRIGLVGITVDRWGPQMADGTLHALEGWVIFAACACILGIELLLFARLSGHRIADSFVPIEPFSKPQPQTLRYEVNPKPLYACMVLVCLAAPLGGLITSRAELVPSRSKFEMFPVTLGEWRGRVSMLDPQVERDLAVQDYILADYKKEGGRAVNLYVAYYGSQRSGKSHIHLWCASLEADGLF